MKIKKLMLISIFLLTVISIGAINAADANSDDTLANSDNNEISAADVNTEDTNTAVSDVKSPAKKSINDAVIADSDNNEISAADVNTEDTNTAVSDVKSPTIGSIETTNVKEASNSKEVLGSHGTYNGHDYYTYIRTDYYDMDINAGSYDVAEIEDDLYVDGTVAFYVDNIQVYSKYYVLAEGKSSVYISIKDLVLPSSITAGLHSVKVTYFKSGAPELSGTASVNFYPALNYLHSMSVGEQNFFRIYAGPGVSGAAKIYLYDNFVSEYKQVGEVNIVNGVATFPFTSTYKTNLDYKIGYIINGRTFSEYANIDVKDNTPGYSASVSPSIYVGNAASVSFSGPKTNGDVIIYVDGKQVKKSTYFGGNFVDSIQGLSIGTHQVTIQYSRGDDFFSRSFNVNVIAKPAKKTTKKTKKNTIKLVTAKSISKKAKKFVIKAKLKVKGKVGKKKKVIFKFNGKKYKTKTNKKGIAKVTIKKAVLKKLKVGKKVKISVKYGSKTVKKSIKVKK